MLFLLNFQTSDWENLLFVSLFFLFFPPELPFLIPSLPPCVYVSLSIFMFIVLITFGAERYLFLSLMLAWMKKWRILVAFIFKTFANVPGYLGTCYNPSGIKGKIISIMEWILVPSSFTFNDKVDYISKYNHWLRNITKNWRWQKKMLSYPEPSHRGNYYALIF